jgi:glycosyltransferase involved in cell wall biosynthesis
MVSSQPLVTVVIPSYNHSKYIQQAIQSVIEQTYERIELIVIDDGSSDESVNKINEMFNNCQHFLPNIHHLQKLPNAESAHLPFFARSIHDS